MTRRRKIFCAVTASILAALLLLVLRRGEAVPVDTSTVRRGSIEEVVSSVAAGTVKARRESVVSARGNGTVTKVYVSEGGAVRAGAPLVLLEDPELSRQIEAAAAEVRLADETLNQAEARLAEARKRHTSNTARAKANLDQSRNDLRRSEELQRNGFVSQAELDLARTRSLLAEEDARVAELGEETVRAAEREVGAARARHSIALSQAAALAERRTKLLSTAPFDGIVVAKSVEVGETKAFGTPLVTLADPSDLFVEAEVDESESGKVHVGMDARLLPDAYQGESFPATVSEVRPVISASKEVTRANVIEVRPTAPKKPLRIGMSADVEVVVGRKENALSVPSAAVMERDGKKSVYLIRDGRAIRQPVTTGVGNWESVEAVSGLSEGDLVVTTLDAPGLAEGARVDVRTGK